jgi:hypothetical protein
VVVEDAFVGRGKGVLVEPRIALQAPPSSITPFPVRLRLPSGEERAAMATLDVAHIRGPNGTYAMVRLVDLTPGDVPAGTEIWRDEAP